MQLNCVCVCVWGGGGGGGGVFFCVHDQQCNNTMNGLCQAKTSQRAHYVYTTSPQRRRNVMSMKFMQRRLNTDATSCRYIDVEATFYERHNIAATLYRCHEVAKTLYKRHVPAGMS